MVEGLSLDLKCYVHNESFATPTEFREHENSKPHGHQGQTICVDCQARGIKCPCKIDEEDIEKGGAMARCPKCTETLEKKILKKMEKKDK